MGRWNIVPLGDACDLIGGGTPSKKNSAYYSGSIPWATVRDMSTDVISETDFQITKEAIRESSSNVIPGGNVVIATRVGLGKVCLVERDTAINQDLRGVVPKQPGVLLSRFLFYWCKTVAPRIVAAGTGATVQGVKVGFVKSLPIPLPPLPEQERIVAILDEAFAAIATATANAEKNLANARELFESVRHNSLARTTEEWERRPLGAVCENLDRLRVPITKSKRVPGRVPYYGASGVVDHVAEYLFDEDLLLVSEDGANLLARTYPIAFSISGKSWVNNHAHVLQFTTDTQREFVERYLNSIPLDEWVSGMAQPKLNQRSLNSIPIPWTEDDEPMRLLTNGLREAGSRTKDLTELTEQKLAHLTNLTQSLLHKAFTGELTADSKAADRSLSEANV
jgi:type I restriction enzyme, S subunit